jgi:hypothetical protein
MRNPGAARQWAIGADQVRCRATTRMPNVITTEPTSTACLGLPELWPMATAIAPEGGDRVALAAQNNRDLAGGDAAPNPTADAGDHAGDPRSDHRRLVGP